jgi:polynucleotide 5'-hydroxyl-kinase GRC3/NOL9
VKTRPYGYHETRARETSVSEEPLRHREHFPFLAMMEVPPEWEAAARRFLETDGAVMVLGAPDAGKSTLCRYLIYRAFAAGLPAALIDLDLGQSHLGPPACLGLGLFPPRLPGDDSLTADGLYFVGQTSPVGALLEVAVGCRVLADLAARQGVRRLVVNTSGFIQGPGALKLKRAQAELLHPSMILGLRSGSELEPLLRGLGGAAPPRPAPAWAILTLPVSSRARRRGPEERRLYREERFRRYFAPARRLAVPWGSLVWEGLPWGQGEPLDPEARRRLEEELQVPVLYGETRGRRVTVLVSQPPPAPLRPGEPEEAVHWLSWSGLHLRLLGLLDAGRRTLALGLILPEPFHPEDLALWTPLSPEQKAAVRFLKAGPMRVSLEGRELP